MVYSGSVLVGLAPSQGGVFAIGESRRLLVVRWQRGSRRWHGCRGRRRGDGATLFGTFDFPIHQASTDTLNNTGSSPNEFRLAGCDIQFSQLALSDGRIELQGDLTLPVEAGGFHLAVHDPQKIVISGTGVSLAGGPLRYPIETLF